MFNSFYCYRTVPEPDEMISLVIYCCCLLASNMAALLSRLSTMIGGPPLPSSSSFSKQESSSSRRGESLAFSTTAFPFSSTYPVYLKGSVDFFLLLSLLASPLGSPCFAADETLLGSLRG